MHTGEKIIKTYNATAQTYAATRIDELKRKPLDKLLLNEFARLNKGTGTCIDLGCGPGQTTKYLFDAGLKDVAGVDISQEMIKEASKLFPDIKFETGDLLSLPYKSNEYHSAIAFYAIVNFNYDQVDAAFQEVGRVIKTGADFLFSYHVGDGLVHFDDANGVDVDIDMYLFQTNRIVELLNKNKFQVIDAIERLPYPGEYETKRGYVWARKL